MEQWHQKLHNNTTPDDVPICEAYLLFLEDGVRANGPGSLDVFWAALAERGLSKARLASFDRPITSDPEWYSVEKAKGMIPDFYEYLGVLKAVHAGADLSQSARAAASAGALPDAARAEVAFLQAPGRARPLPVVRAVVRARRALEAAGQARGEGTRVDAAYLDLALEDAGRAAAERGAGRRGAAALIGPLLESLCLSEPDNEELCFCLAAWRALPTRARGGAGPGEVPSEDEARQAVAALDRLGRALAASSDRVVDALAGPSRAIGLAAECDAWAIDLFPEEVVRGGPAFAVSLVLGAVEPSLRRAAGAGSWQVVSPAPADGATGVVRVVPGLAELQEATMPEPTLLIADVVTGEEEVPEGCIGVLTPCAPDVLSHVAVRARNLRTLFATCHDRDELERLKTEWKGRRATVTTTAAGDVTIAEAAEVSAADAASASSSSSSSGTATGSVDAAVKKRNLQVERPRFGGRWAVGIDAFAPGVVGAKSKNTAALRGRLPADVRLPASVAIPFGAFEETLALPENRAAAAELDRLSKEARRAPTPADRDAFLEQCRAIAASVVPSPDLAPALRKAAVEAGLPGHLLDDGPNWDAAQRALLSVWASKYNGRAFVSCSKVGVDFDAVTMSVLVQEVVSPRYAFVLHTTNPLTEDKDEIYGELVAGLGETLVSGMYPGRSLGFACRKDPTKNGPGALLPDTLRIEGYPSKSVGLFCAESLIFRSDSSGEDLEGYAGAGLYDSVTTAVQREETLDASSSRLMTDEAFRRETLLSVLRAAAAVEGAMGSPQDIEGVVGGDGSVTVVQTRPQV